MYHLGPVLVSLVLTLVSPAAREIESSFLQGEAGCFEELIPPGSFLNVSFSPPDAFSDLLSRDQAVLWFRKVFRTNRTLGFYPDPPLLERGAVIYKARWELETPDLRQVAYDVLFLLRPRPVGSAPQVGPLRFWIIAQVRAEHR